MKRSVRARSSTNAHARSETSSFFPMNFSNSSLSSSKNRSFYTSSNKTTAVFICAFISCMACLSLFFAPIIAPNDSHSPHISLYTLLQTKMGNPNALHSYKNAKVDLSKPFSRFNQLNVAISLLITKDPGIFHA